MKKMKLYDLIEKIAKDAIEKQNNDGSFNGGKNGYKNDPETPVRNTSHWLIVLLEMYKYTKKEEYRISAEKALSYLLSIEARPMKYTFWLRKNPHKDACNGLVGQAFVIHALALAYEVLENHSAKQLAEEVFLMHPFNNQIGLWSPVAVDGTYLPISDTLNHQLYFASAGAILWRVGSNQEVFDKINTFVEKLEDNVEIHRLRYRGLLYHYSTSFYNRKGSGMFAKWIRLSMFIKQQSKNEVLRATGYHLYNVWVLSLLKGVFPKKEFWNSNKFRYIVEFYNSKYFMDTKNKYGFTEPDGSHRFENLSIREAQAIYAFSKSNNNIEIITNILSRYVQQEYDLDSKMLNKHSIDKDTQAARLYEAMGLPNIDIKVEARIFDN